MRIDRSLLALRSTVSLLKPAWDSALKSSSMAPFEALPIELLRQIFLEFLPGPPTALSQVSALWRAVAISLPNLWSSISMSLTEKTASRRVHLLSMWVDRAAGLSVRLSLYVDPMVTDDSFVRIVARNLHKFSHLRLTIPSRSHACLYEALHTRSAPLLEILQVKYSASSSTPTTLSGAPLSIIAPRLHSLLWPIFPDALSLDTRTSLTDLTVTSLLSIKDAISLLSRLPELSSATFTRLGQLGNPYPPDAADGLTSIPLNLPNLHSLALHTAYSQPIAPILNVLTLPMLERFTASDDTRFVSTPSVWSQIAFEHMLLRSGKHSETGLRELRLLNVVGDEDELLACLRLTGGMLELLHLSDRKGLAVSVLTDIVRRQLVGPTAVQDDVPPALVAAADVNRMSESQSDLGSEDIANSKPTSENCASPSLSPSPSAEADNRYIPCPKLKLLVLSKSFVQHSSAPSDDFVSKMLESGRWWRSSCRKAGRQSPRRAVCLRASHLN